MRNIKIEWYPQTNRTQLRSKDIREKPSGSVVALIFVFVLLIITGLFLPPRTTENTKKDSGPIRIETSEKPETSPNHATKDEVSASRVPTHRELEKIRVGNVSWGQDPRVRINNVWHRVGDGIRSVPGYSIVRIEFRKIYLRDPYGRIVEFMREHSGNSTEDRRKYLSNQIGE